MKSTMDWIVDQRILVRVLEALAAQGVSPVRARDLTRASSDAGHRVPKKFIRVRLTENGDGVTGVEGVMVVEDSRRTFWYSWIGRPAACRCDALAELSDGS
jgi:hypothetical protein